MTRRGAFRVETDRAGDDDAAASADPRPCCAVRGGAANAAGAGAGIVAPASTPGDPGVLDVGVVYESDDASWLPEKRLAIGSTGLESSEDADKGGGTLPAPDVPLANPAPPLAPHRFAKSAQVSASEVEPKDAGRGPEAAGPEKIPEELSVLGRLVPATLGSCMLFTTPLGLEAEP